MTTVAMKLPQQTQAIIKELVQAVFSVRSVPRLYNKGQLPLAESLETAVRRVGGWCEMAVSLGVIWSNGLVERQWPDPHGR
jgi:hypothetical protein